MSKKEIKEQLKLLPEEKASETIDLSPPSITIGRRPIVFDPIVTKVSNLNKSIREFHLDKNCQLSLTFDSNYSKMRMFCSPEELEEKIQNAIFATPSMGGKLINVSKALNNKKEEIEKLKNKEEINIYIPIVGIDKFDEKFQMQTKEIGITLELNISRYSELAFHISCRFF